MEFVNIFLGTWDKAQEATLKLIKMIPEDKLDFKLQEKSFTTKELVHHMYSAEEVCIGAIIDKGEVKFEDFENLKTTAADLKTVDDLYEYARKVHEETREKIGKLGKEDFLKTINSFFGPLPLFAFLNGIFMHFTHHRGQIYVFLRMCGVEEELPNTI
jgi:uncharacterized damage-inducible protein DinB